MNINRNIWALGLIACVVTVVWRGIDQLSHRCGDPMVFEDSSIRKLSFSALEMELEKTDPQKLARCHYRMGDCRLLALDGIVPEVPGVNDEDRGDFKRRYFIATSDKLVSDSHLSWVRRARGYALKFNEEMLRLCHR